MRIRLFATPERLARALALDIARCLRERPRLVLGLPTGHTPVPLYGQLAALSAVGRIDFSRATTFNLDEFVGLAPGDPRSYHAFMQHHLFSRVNLAPRRTHVLNGAARDLARECERYERAIARAGGIDVQILGVGANGHIGFNEPAPALHARTHRTRLQPATRQANAFLFDDRMSAVPREALSMGMETILHARRVVLIATGSHKAACVKRMIRGMVTPQLPASFLQLHRHAEVWLDVDAAARLKPRAPSHRRGKRSARL